MDEMDRLLNRLPGEPCPPELVFKTLRKVHIYRQRRLWLRFAVSGLLALVGLWLVAVNLSAAGQTFALPDSGLLLLLDWSGMSLNNIGLAMLNLVESLSISQRTLASLGGVAIPGFMALGFGILLLLGYLLPSGEL